MEYRRFRLGIVLHVRLIDTLNGSHFDVIWKPSSVRHIVCGLYVRADGI